MAGNGLARIFKLVTLGTTGTMVQKVCELAHGEREEPTGSTIVGELGALTLAGALSGTAGQVVLGVAAGKIAAQSWRNHRKATTDALMEASGTAVYELLEPHTPRMRAAPRRAMTRLATRTLRDHKGANVAEGPDALDPERVRRVLTDPEGSILEGAPDSEFWLGYIRRLAGASEHQLNLSTRKMERIAGTLAADYPDKLFEVIRRDAAAREGAFGSAVVEQLRAVLADVAGSRARDEKLSGEVNELREVLSAQEGPVAAALNELAAQYPQLNEQLRSLDDGVMRTLEATQRGTEENRARFQEVMEGLAALQEGGERSGALESLHGGEPHVGGKDPNRKEPDAGAWLEVELIGREASRDFVLSHLKAGSRHVSIVGAPGAGKTSLVTSVAYDVVRDLSEEFPQGCCAVTFASLRSADRVVQEIVEQLELKMPQDNEGHLEFLLQALRTRRMVVLLDNCEHLLDRCREVVAEIMNCPGITVLTTSRRSFGRRNETVIELAPLATPTGESVELLRESTAVQLFMERMGSFDLNAANAPQVAAVGRATAGLPLAIELLAAACKIHGLSRVAEDVPGTLAEQRQADGVDGARTMDELVRLSYDLLTEDRRRAFRRLACFDGGWNHAAQDAVVGREAAADVAFLVESSLVVRTPDGERQFMLEPIRQFAEKEAREAKEGDFEDARRAHAEHYLSDTEGVHDELLWGDKKRTTVLLELDHDNLRRAIRWSARRGHSATARGLVAHLWRFWEQRAYLAEGRHMIQLAMKASEDPQHAATDPSTEEAKRQEFNVLLGDTTLAYRMGRAEEALAIAERARSLAIGLNDEASANQAHNDMGNALAMLGRFDESRDVFEECHRAYVTRLAQLESVARGGAHDGAEHARELKRVHRDLAVVSYNLGAYYFNGQEDLDRSLEYLRAAKAGFEAGDVHDDVPYPLTLIGLIAAIQGEPEIARKELARAIELRKDQSVGLAESLDALAQVELIEGNYDASWALLHAAWKHARGADSQKVLARVIDTRVRLATAEEQAGLAMQALGFGNELRKSSSMSRRNRFERLIEGARLTAHATLGEESSSNNRSHGMVWSLDEAESELFADRDGKAMGGSPSE